MFANMGYFIFIELCPSFARSTDLQFHASELIISSNSHYNNSEYKSYFWCDFRHICPGFVFLPNIVTSIYVTFNDNTIFFLGESSERFRGIFLYNLREMFRNMYVPQ